MGDICPPRRRVDECLYGDDLPNDQHRERVEVDLVNPAIDDEVADHAETDQRVYAGRRETSGNAGKRPKAASSSAQEAISTRRR
jgi:hypothetical protein